MCAANGYQIVRVRALAAEADGPQAERMALVTEWRDNIAVNAQRALAVGLSGSRTLEAQFADEMRKSSARRSARQGGDAVKGIVRTMEGISASSRKIA